MIYVIELAQTTLFSVGLRIFNSFLDALQCAGQAAAAVSMTRALLRANSSTTVARRMRATLPVDQLSSAAKNRLLFGNPWHIEP